MCNQIVLFLYQVDAIDCKTDVWDFANGSSASHFFLLTFWSSFTKLRLTLPFQAQSMSASRADCNPVTHEIVDYDGDQYWSFKHRKSITQLGCHQFAIIWQWISEVIECSLPITIYQMTTKVQINSCNHLVSKSIVKDPTIIWIYSIMGTHWAGTASTCKFCRREWMNRILSPRSSMQT